MIWTNSAGLDTIQTGVHAGGSWAGPTLARPSNRSGAMPTYEYRCLECDMTFEKPERIADHEANRASCPGCGSEKVEQVFSSFFAKTSRKS